MADEGKPEPVVRRRGESRRREGASARRVWCAYNADGSCFVLFGQELAAMRYAVEHSMNGCRAMELGVPLQEQIK